MKVVQVACYIYWLTAAFIVVFLTVADYSTRTMLFMLLLLMICFVSLSWLLHTLVPPDEMSVHETYWYEDESYTSSDLDWWGRP